MLIVCEKLLKKSEIKNVDRAGQGTAVSAEVL